MSIFVLLSSAFVAACSVTSPRSCTAGSTSTVANGTLHDPAGVELGNVTVVVQRIEGDTIPAWFRMVTLAQGSSALSGHVLTATLADSVGRPVYQVELHRPEFYIADATMKLRDPGTIANLEARLASSSLTLVLTTDVRGLPVVRTPLVLNTIATGANAPICFRTGGLFD